MARDYNKEKFENGVLEFEGSLIQLNEKKRGN